MNNQIIQNKDLNYTFQNYLPEVSSSASTPH